MSRGSRRIYREIMKNPSTSSSTTLSYKAKRQYRLALQIIRYCLLALQSSTTSISPNDALHVLSISRFERPVINNVVVLFTSLIRPPTKTSVRHILLFVLFRVNLENVIWTWVFSILLKLRWPNIQLTSSVFMWYLHVTWENTVCTSCNFSSP